MRDTIDAHRPRKPILRHGISIGRLCPYAGLRPCRCHPRSLSRATFPAASQGKNHHVGNFGQQLGRLAIIFALLIAAPFVVAPVWAQSVGLAGPASGIVDEQQKIVDELKRRPTIQTRIAASCGDDTKLVKSGCSSRI